MSANSQQSSGNSLARGLIPPYVVLPNFLDEDMVAGLLDFAVSRRSDFTPATVGQSAILDPSYRVATVLRDLGKFKQLFNKKILELVPSLVNEMRATPVVEPNLETQLVAHGDGAFFKPA